MIVELTTTELVVEPELNAVQLTITPTLTSGSGGSNISRTSQLINDGEDGTSPFATQQYVAEHGGTTPDTMLKSVYDTNNDGKVDNANYADNAGHSTTSDSSTSSLNAEYATDAGHATNADTADSASTAITSDTATRAIQDQYGNIIDTYYKKIENSVLAAQVGAYTYPLLLNKPTVITGKLPSGVTSTFTLPTPTAGKD